MEKALPVPRVILALLVVLVFSPMALSAKRASTEQYLQELHAAGKEKVIVTFEKEIQPSIVKKYGQVLKTLKIINGVVAIIDKDNITALKNESGIKNVAIDAVISIPRLPPRQFSIRPASIFETLDSNSIIVGWNLKEPGMAAENAWNRYLLDGSNIIIAILDTGVRYDFQDLDAPKYLGGYDFVNNDSDPNDDNYANYGHGTSVTTIALAQGQEKIKGVAPGASYYALKVMPSAGDGYVSDVIEGLGWCITADPKPDIVNMSLGTPEYDSEFEAACNTVYNAGIILVAGSGNDIDNPNSLYPAAFANVISVGSHDDTQHVYYKSNGGVDCVAPGRRVTTMDIYGTTDHLYTGTSYATPHAVGLIALQLQYARQNNIQPNNGYLWEVMKHSAKDLGDDPVYQGSGKIYAAYTDDNDANIGSIDLMAANWPVDNDFTFSDYAFTDGNYPVYQIGSDVNQTITLINITDILGNTIETIEDLNVVATQVYYSDPNDQNLPGDSVEIFPTISLLEPNDANSITLSLLYTIPPETIPGLVKTTIDLEFKFAGNSRIITVAYNEPNSLWYAAIPADLDLSNTVSLSDFSIFAEQWQQTGCTEPEWCGRADINHSGSVGWPDLSILAENWLTGL
jgi:hypothetical protein